MDLRAVNRVLTGQDGQDGQGLAPGEWWLHTAPGATPEAAAALRARPDIDPSQVLVRDETAQALRNDPLGAGPEAAFSAAAVAAAVLAAVRFAVIMAGALRARGGEFAVLRALGASRRAVARAVAVEYGVLVASALLVGVVLGIVLTRMVVPLIVLTPAAGRPVPDVLVALPAGREALLLAVVAAAPAAITAFLAVRRSAPVAGLRTHGTE